MTIDEATDGDEGELQRVLGESFRIDDGYWPIFYGRLGRDAFRVVRQGGRLVGGLALYRMGQVFGGRSVPMWGVAVVGVAPAARGRGVGRAMMAGTVREMAERRVPISALYPATVPLYRSVGYAYAGNRFLWAVDADRIGVRDRSLEIREVGPGDPEVREAYRIRALRSQGNLDRNDAIWARIAGVPPGEGPLIGYGAFRDGRLEAYVFYGQRGLAGIGYDVVIRDFVALTADGGRAIWALLRDGWSMFREVSWHGPATDPRATLLPHNTWRLKDQLRWMLRICSLPEAMVARGWPAHLQAELALTVDDPLVADNSGTWTLRITGGRAEVERGGIGGLTLGIDALATLYAGMHDASTLRWLGLIEGDDRSVALADAIFAAPEPWMPDMF